MEAVEAAIPLMERARKWISPLEPQVDLTDAITKLQAGIAARKAEASK